MKFSVVTICFNEIDNIEKTINSVLEQNFSDFEYIVIDGGSNDGTIGVIEKYSDYLTRFVSEPDEGVYDAMNKSLNFVTGEYVIFMNAGDYFTSNNVLLKFDEDIDMSFDIVFGDTISDYSYKKVLRRASPDKLSSLETFDNMPCCHQSMFLRSSLAKEFGFEREFKIASDYNMLFSIISKYDIVYKYIETPVAIISTGGVSDLKRIDMFKEKYKIQSHFVGQTLSRKILLYKKIAIELVKGRFRSLVRWLKV